MASSDQRPRRVLFLIRQLEIGGAERQLLTLVRGLPRERWEPTVVTMYRSGGLAEEFAKVPGLRVVSLDKQGRYDLAGFGKRLRRVIQETRPDVVHGYMYGANEIALVAGLLAGIPVVWGIRVSAMDFGRYNRWTHSVFKAGLMASRLVDLVIANSEAGLRHHEAIGLRGRRHLVIPNGIDVSRFQRDDAAGLRWRQSHQFSADDFVISMIGRFDPMKDHATFFRVVAELRRNGISARFVCVGEGNAAQTERVYRECTECGVADVVTFAAPSTNPVAIYSGSSLIVSTSAFGEGFPNVVGEAMACEVPCISTDTGDAGQVIGNPMWVRRPGDVPGLTLAVERFIELSSEKRAELGRGARVRIESEFSVARLVRLTENALQSVVR